MANAECVRGHPPRHDIVAGVNYTQRPLRAEDAPSWSALTKAISTADGTDEEFSADDLAEELTDPSCDVERDTFAVVTPDDTVAAFAQVHQPVQRLEGGIRARFVGGVHPEHRRRGLGSGLLRRVEVRVGELGSEMFPGCEVRPMTGAVPAFGPFLESRGYAATRWFHSMSRALGDVGELASDSRVRGYDPALDEQVRLAHLDAFAGHWDFAPPSVQRWRFWCTGARPFRAECSAIVVADDETVDGYILAYSYVPDEIYFGQIGVRERARNTGLGRALVHRALTLAAQAGYREAKLDVDSANATGAGRLYENAGFVTYLSSAAYQRVEPV
jgi:mycothiol synthase